MADPKYPRLHINMLPKTAEALNSLADTTGLSRTDCVNRAIQLYYLVDQWERDNKDIAVYNPDDRTYQHLKLL